MNVRHGLEIPWVNVERINRNTGYQVPLESGHFARTNPAKDVKGLFLMNPCGQFLKSKEQEDAEVGHRIKSKSSVEPILSVRAFEFGSLYGLDILVPSPTDPALTVWDTVCLGTQLFCRQKSLIGTAKHQETIDTSSGTTLRGLTKHPFQNSGNLFSHLRERETFFDLDSVFKTRTERNGRLFSKKSAYILTHTNATVTKKIGHVLRQRQKQCQKLWKGVSPYTWIKEVSENNKQGEV